MNQELRILLVDDDSTDRELFIDAISGSGKQCEIMESGNVEEALQYLATAKRLPNLIILDLNMPIMDGRATLKQLKKTEAYKCIPVCILSTSSARFDVVLPTIQALTSFWLNHSILNIS